MKNSCRHRIGRLALALVPALVGGCAVLPGPQTETAELGAGWYHGGHDNVLDAVADDVVRLEGRTNTWNAATQPGDWDTLGEIETATGADIQEEPSEGAFADGDKTKLDGIEASADVTDAANVQAAGALMDSEVTNLAEVKAFDSTDYATGAEGDLASSAVQTNHSGDAHIGTADGDNFAAGRYASNDSKTNCVMLGHLAGDSASGNNNFYGGYEAGSGSSGAYNFYGGHFAGASSEGDYNFYGGYEAGDGANGGANFYGGSSAGIDADGNHNFYGGHYAGDNADGNRNFYGGEYAGTSSSGDENFYGGYYAGNSAEGDRNFYGGNSAGIDAIGNSNFYGGRNAGESADGNRNFYGGNSAGKASATEKSTLIGLFAGRNASDDNSVYIDAYEWDPGDGHDANNDNIVIRGGELYLGRPTGNTHIRGTVDIEGIGTMILDTTSGAPASAGDTGTTGEIRYDGGYLYICIATDTWMRAQVATW